MKRAQAAMEFLMTYGWAILVVLVAIGALAYFGVLSPARFLPESCTMAPGIGCDDFKITYDAGGSTIQLLLRNGMGETVSGVNVAIIGCTSDAGASTTWTDGALLESTSITDGILLDSCTTAVVSASGARVKANVNLTWTSSSGLSKQRIGALTGKAE
jgi:hypothetical protein